MHFYALLTMHYYALLLYVLLCITTVCIAMYYHVLLCINYYHEDIVEKPGFENSSDVVCMLFEGFQGPTPAVRTATGGGLA